MEKKDTGNEKLNDRRFKDVEIDTEKMGYVMVNVNEPTESSSPLDNSTEDLDLSKNCKVHFTFSWSS